MEPWHPKVCCNDLRFTTVAKIKLYLELNLRIFLLLGSQPCPSSDLHQKYYHLPASLRLMVWISTRSTLVLGAPHLRIRSVSRSCYRSVVLVCCLSCQLWRARNCYIKSQRRRDYDLQNAEMKVSHHINDLLPKCCTCLPEISPLI